MIMIIIASVWHEKMIGYFSRTMFVLRPNSETAWSYEFEDHINIRAFFRAKWKILCLLSFNSNIFKQSRLNLVTFNSLNTIKHLSNTAGV